MRAFVSSADDQICFLENKICSMETQPNEDFNNEIPFKVMITSKIITLLCLHFFLIAKVPFC